jgi:ribose transport system substrate-binding protein
MKYYEPKFTEERITRKRANTSMIHFTRICALHILFILFFTTHVWGRTKILVIPKGTQATYWQSVVAGARQAGEDLGVEVTIRAPFTETQHESQLRIIDFGIRQGFKAIVLAPNHKELVVPALEKAAAQGIKIVLIDSGTHSSYHAPLICSDNYAAGKMAANYIASQIGDSGKIILVRHMSGHLSTSNREQAFIDTIGTDHPGLKIVEDPYVGSSQGEAYHRILEILKQVRDVDGIFAVGEEVTLGTLRALEDSENKMVQRDIMVIGFDLNTIILNALRDHTLRATILQNPERIGYLGVETASRLIQGEVVPDQIYTELMLITDENIDTDQAQEAVGRYFRP